MSKIQNFPYFWKTAQICFNFFEKFYTPYIPSLLHLMKDRLEKLFLAKSFFCLDYLKSTKVFKMVQISWIFFAFLWEKRKSSSVFSWETLLLCYFICILSQKYFRHANFCKNKQLRFCLNFPDFLKVNPLMTTSRRNRTLKINLLQKLIFVLYVWPLSHVAKKFSCGALEK